MATTPPSSQGLEFVGQKVKILVDAINDLRNFGLEQVVDLPELVLVGDQSAGKSSLMSALTEVQLPRDQGICTKCPANLKTSPAETWSCKVSLQRYYRYENPRGGIIDQKSVTKKNPFPPWKEQTLDIREFKTIDDKSELEQVIKWAQIALLNPNDDFTDFIPGTGARSGGSFERERDSTIAKFSPNVIAIEISGPGLPALSFYDLPGIFRLASDRKEQYLAMVIENLAIKYIQRPNALIIWTLAMKTDPNNSHTGKVIQDCEATDRCLGVLTNPDHVSARHVEYERVLQGKSHIIKHGYFVTKQPGDDAVLEGPHYHSDAREDEMKFFTTDKLWTGEWAQFRSRCGTTAIQKFLSTELARQIMASIPSITEKIATRSREVDRQLSECPDLPDSDIRNIIMRRLSDFSNDVKNVMYGEASSDFQSEWSTLADQFRDMIIHIKPMVTLSHESDTASSSGIIEILSDDEDNFVRPSLVSNRKRGAQSAEGSPSPIRQKMMDGTTRPMKYEDEAMQPPSTPSRSQNRNPFSKTVFGRFAGLGQKFIDLAGIRTYITKHQSGLPGIPSPQTYNELQLKSVKSWNHILEVFMTETFSLVEKHLLEILHVNLGMYEQTALYKASKQHLRSFLSEIEEKERKSLRELYELETFKSYTINKAAVDDFRAKELQILTNQRKIIRAQAYVRNQMRNDRKARIPTDLPAEERNRKMKEKIAAVKDEQLPTDPFIDEIAVAAYIRGYYMTAGMRFIDSVCLSMKGRLFRSIRQSVSFYLEMQLGITSVGDGEDICRGLMEEDDTIAKHRRNLRQEKDKLTGFSRRLAALLKQIEETDSNDHADGRRSSRGSSGTDNEMGGDGPNGAVHRFRQNSSELGI
ncbi:P-loop containing nucleoside triphosphate hydrolase protein [Leptodontidium sp. 2 PMI_412]|nr:P-loop containing nucleoside triphosphate hydrolase protein [Leptodontidium sp. 2 PMI_412]